MKKAVLITGSAKRIGAEIVRALACDGWDVAIHCNKSATEAEALVDEVIEEYGVKAVIVQGDLADSSDAHRIVKQASAKLEGLSCLIHNASMFEKDSLENLTELELSEHLAVNLQSPILMTQAFAAQFEDSDNKGNVIYLLDGMKNWSISPIFFSYSVSRNAMESSLPLIAASLAPHIRVNGVALGATLEGAMDKKNTFAKIRSITPLKSTSNVEEVCNSIRFLLSINSITGQIIDLSSGMALGRLKITDKSI